tara:strand:+ start:279 stop:527 length:249 start_codon:yes stop_codon:yes gene_type:complete
MARHIPPSLKNEQKNLLESFRRELGYLETSLNLDSNPSHPRNSAFSKKELDENIKKTCLKERISLYELLIQVVKDFKYQEEN